MDYFFFFSEICISENVQSTDYFPSSANIPALEDTVYHPTCFTEKIKILYSHLILPKVCVDKLHTMCLTYYVYYVYYSPKSIFMVSLTQNNIQNPLFFSDYCKAHYVQHV